MKRDDILVDLRPMISTIKPELMTSKQETFQNEVVRPIIKFQHDLIVTLFKTYLVQKKIQLIAMTTEHKIANITAIVSRDRALAIQLQSIIIAYFTIDEYENYNSMKSAINKRILQIIRERIISTFVHKTD